MCWQIICLIYMYKEDLVLKTYNAWYAIKPKQTYVDIGEVDL